MGLHQRDRCCLLSLLCAGMSAMLSAVVVRSAEASQVVTCDAAMPGECAANAIAPENVCTIYMAESTIPGAGLGTFTGVELQKGDSVGHGDVMIALTDYFYHFQALGEKMMQRDDWEFIDPTWNYVWYGSELGMHRETAHARTSVDYVTGTLQQ
jgi:hypothetical protein